MKFSATGKERIVCLKFAKAIVCPAGELVRICERLLREDGSVLARTADFLSLLRLLETGCTDFLDLETPPEIMYAIGYITDNLSSVINIKALAETVNMSVSTFERKFSRYVGMLPNQYIIQRRLSSAAEMLARGKNVTETCHACGFSDYSHFIARFKHHFGITPLKYGKTEQQ